MPSEQALSKRIKRHVIGRVREYFISVPPGFETLCYDELTKLPLSVKNARIVKGGIEFEGRLKDCFIANLNLRFATKILMRIDSFRAENFGKFKKKMVQIPWEIYLHQGENPLFHITTSKSRLYHKGAIYERSIEAINERFKEHRGLKKEPDSKKHASTIHIKSENNIFTLSLDSSGALLYKRGIKTHGGKAPLRETTAAAILKTAGYDSSMPLIDPMCGSGTFALEGAMAGNRIAPGIFREFAFTGWPGFPRKRWDHIKKGFEKMRVFPDKPYIFAMDKDDAACNALYKTVKNHGLDDTIIVRQGDFFSFLPEKFTDQKGLVAINPPYGKRMGKTEESRKMFIRICRHLKEKYGGWKLVLIVSDKNLLKYLPFNMDSYKFFHGGIKLNFIVGRIY